MGGGGLAATGGPIAMTLFLALLLVVAGLLVLRSSTMRKRRS